MSQIQLNIHPVISGFARFEDSSGLNKNGYSDGFGFIISSEIPQ